MMKKEKIIFLIALTVLLICFSHFLYEEIMSQIFFRKIWREFFISPITPNFRCWSYEFFSNSLPSECNEKSLVLNEKIKFCRENLNEIYRNYTKNKDWNETEFITNLVGRTMGINLVETLYANLEDITPKEKCDEKDITAIVSKIYYPVDYEEINKMLMTTEILGAYSIKTYYFSTFTKAFFSYCINITNSSQECVNKLMEKLEIISKNLSSQTPPYEEITLPKCPQTVAYIHIKDLEKEMRSQLNKSEDPISIILKTLDISMYSNCSKELYEKVIKNSSCPIISTKKLESFEIVTKHNTILAYCYTKFIKNNLEEINATSNTLRF